MPQKWKRRPYLLSFPILFALASTCAFLYFLYSYMVYIPSGQSLPNWAEFLESDWTTIGTILSGIFSSISVVWIVASVLNQGIELRNQREELEIISNTMKNQEDSMRKQVIALDEQIKIFQSEQKARDQEENRLVLEEYLLQIFDLLIDARVYAIVWEWRYPSVTDYLLREDNPKVNLLSFRESNNETRPIEKKFGAMSTQISQNYYMIIERYGVAGDNSENNQQDTISVLGRRTNRAVVVPRADAREALLEILKIVNEADNLCSEAMISRSALVRINNSKIDQLKVALSKICSDDRLWIPEELTAEEDYIIISNIKNANYW